jgi:type I restriction enzyme S subunit
MSGWPRYPASELSVRGVLRVEDGNHGEYRPRPTEFVENGVAYIRAADMSPRGIDFRGASKISDVAVQRITKGIGKPYDVLLSHKGTVGKVAVVPRDAPPFVCSPQTTFWRSLDSGVLDARFLAYYMSSPDFVRQLDSRKGETDMAAYVSLTEQRKLTVVLPPVGVQQRIAATLGVLDDKIASNRRIDELSLALAVETYRAACSQASHRLALGDAGKWLSGGTPSTEEPAFWSGDLPWISAASLKSFHVAVSDRRLTSAGLQRATNVVPAGTVLMVVRGMSLKTELRMGVAQRPVAFGQDCKAIIPTGVPSALLSTALYSARSEILELVDEAGHGTGRLQWDLLSAFPIAIPDDEHLVPMLDALLARAAAASAESRKLAELRDMLLPELLSGRIRAPEASEAIDDSLA